MDEQAAIAQLKQGNIAGLEVLVHLYETRALRTAQLITRDPALAQDVAQDAFIRAYEHIYQYDPIRPFGPWFLKIVANLAIRAAKRNKAYLPSDEAEVIPDFESLIEQAQTAEQIRAALDKLPPEQRAVFVLRYYADLSEAETASKLALPLGTVKWRLYRARERLKSMLQSTMKQGSADETR